RCVETREDVEDLERDDAGRVGRVGRDPGSAIVGPDRLFPGRLCRAQVRDPDRGAGGRQAGGLSLRERSVVEVVEAGVGEAAKRAREGGLADELAGTPRSVIRPVDRGPCRATIWELR